MHEAHPFLRDLALVTTVAALTTVAFRRLRQPVVFGYLLAGLIIGPHVPIPLVADQATVTTLSELGVVFVMFSLGLEFSLRRLASVGGAAGTIAPLETSLMMWLGYSAGRLLGWSWTDSLFVGGAVAISSTTIIVKVFRDHRVRGTFTDLVLGILVVEDLIAILLLALFTVIAGGGGVSTGQVLVTLGRLLAFLLALLIVGMLVVPRTVRFVARLDSAETLLVASLGLCMGAAWLAQTFGYSVALGAFIAGSLVAESGEQKRVERLIEPVRDLFAAVFFVSVGMQIDPGQIARHLPEVLLFTGLVIAGKTVAVSISAFLFGGGTRNAVQTGMSLAQIGEFSFIIAGIGLTHGVTSSFLYPIVVSVSALTTLTTPWLIGSADRVAATIDRGLPRPLQTFVALYGSWIENLGARSETSAQKSALARVLRTLAIDAAVIVALCLGAAIEVGPMGTRLVARLGLSPWQGRAMVVGGAVLLSAPFVVGIVRNGRALGRTLAWRAFPETGSGRLDPAAAPRRTMIATIQLATLFIVCAPILTITQPFVPAPVGIALLTLLSAVVIVAVWRSSVDLQGHVRAAAEVIVEAIGRQSRSSGGTGSGALARAHDLIPGLGDPVAFELAPGHAAVGRSLADLGIRGHTGATIVGILRGGDVVIVPDGHEMLRLGDVVAIAGARTSIEAAIVLLAKGPGPERSEAEPETSEATSLPPSSRA